MLRFLRGLLYGLLNVYQFMVLVYALLSWIPVPANRATGLLQSAVEPALQPIRRLLARWLPVRYQRLDWSPLVLMLLIQVVKWVLAL